MHTPIGHFTAGIFPEPSEVVMEFLEILGRHRGQLLDKSEHPQYLLDFLFRKLVQIVFHGTFPCTGLKENNLLGEANEIVAILTTIVKKSRMGINAG